MTIKDALIPWLAEHGYGTLIDPDDVFVGLKFPDGTYFSDLQAALQAAYTASRFRFAVELAVRYKLDHVICLRCVNTLANTNWGEDPFSDRLCNNCFWHGRTVQEIAAQVEQLCGTPIEAFKSLKAIFAASRRS